MTRERRFHWSTGADETIKDIDLSGKTFVITGTTSGIGVETARALALKGAHLVMLNRNVEESEKLKKNIQEEKGEDVNIESIKCDLNSLKSVKSAAQEILKKKLKFDCLILNAGVCGPASPVTLDGLESHFGINHVAHFLLLRELLPLLDASSRVVILSSLANVRTGIPSTLTIDEKLALLCPPSPNDANWYRFYARSKMNNVLIAKKLHRDGIKSYSVHPGTYIRTSIFRDSWLATIGSILLSPFTKSISQGAATSVYCAAHPEVEDVSGKHWDSCWDDEKGLDKEMANDEKLQDALWEHTNKIIDGLVV